MTLSAALNTATSSLRSIQTQLAVSASNIANADDVNYTRKTAHQSSVVTSTVGTGVTITSIGSSVDANLIRAIVEATASYATAQTRADYLQSLSDALGTLYSDGSGDTLATSLTSLETTLEQLAATPESVSLKSEAVADLDDALTDLRETSSQVQTLRTNADSDIADAIATVNDALHLIDDLNDAIVRAKAAGQSTSDLEDQRSAALQTVSEQIGISYYTTSSGALQVYAEGGSLLVGSTVHELSFTATGSFGAAATYPGVLSGITVDGKDITSSIKTGAVAALVELRDTTLPAVQSDLDALAVGIRDTLNAIANEGSASPPPNSLTGSETFSSTDALSATGTLSVAVTGTDGNVAATQDFDLSAYATVGDLVSALNAAGLGMTASLDSSGHLVLQADDSAGGIAMSGGSIGGETASGYFGLNDVVTGDGAASIAVTSSLLSDPSRFPTGAISSTFSVGDKAVSGGSGTLAQSMADAMLSADFSGAAGTLVGNVGSLLSSANTRASSTQTSLTTLTATFSSRYGVNVDEETALIAELQNAYAASAQILSAVQSMFDDLLNAVR
jgi:flagellar hook-associated protein FlgK